MGEIPPTSRLLVARLGGVVQVLQVPGIALRLLGGLTLFI